MKIIPINITIELNKIKTPPLNWIILIITTEKGNNGANMRGDILELKIEFNFSICSWRKKKISSIIFFIILVFFLRVKILKNIANWNRMKSLVSLRSRQYVVHMLYW